MTLVDLRHRRLIHTDAERDRATAELRVAQADLDAAKKRLDECVARRRAAVWHADDVGIPKTHIAKTLKLKAHSNVDRLLERFKGADVNAARRFYEKLGRGKAVKAMRGETPDA